MHVRLAVIFKFHITPNGTKWNLKRQKNETKKYCEKCSYAYTKELKSIYNHNIHEPQCCDNYVIEINSLITYNFLKKKKKHLAEHFVHSYLGSFYAGLYKWGFMP